MARAVGIAVVLMAGAGVARPQAPRSKPAPPAQDQEGDMDPTPAKPARAGKPAARADAKAAPGNTRPGADAGAPNGVDEDGNPIPAPNPGRGGNGPGGPGGRGGGGRNGSALERLQETLTNPSAPVAATLLPLPPIQKELKLTERQKAAIQKLVQAQSQQGRVFGQQRRELMMAARMSGMMPDLGELQAQEAALQQEGEAGFAAILTKAEQRRRLNQIALQLQGPLAVARPEIAEKLNLSPGQQADIEALMMERQAGLDQLRNERRMAGWMGRDPNAAPAGRDPNASKGPTLDQKSKKLQADVRGRIGRILNPKQKENYYKMLGEPFDLASLDDPRPGPRRPGGSGPADAPPPPGGDGSMPKDRTAAKAAPKDSEADADSGDAPPPKMGRPRGPARKAAKAAMPEDDQN